MGLVHMSLEEKEAIVRRLAERPWRVSSSKWIAAAIEVLDAERAETQRLRRELQASCERLESALGRLHH